jgi:hypothetical protein
MLMLVGISCAALAFILIFSSGSPLHTLPPAGGGAAGGNGYNVADRSQSKPPLTLPLNEGAWLVVSIVGGGFDGKGMGDMAANSSGEVVATAPSAPQERHFSCKTRLADEELRQLASVVSSARGREWVARYADPKSPDGCCDQYSYLLELHQRQPGGGEQVYTVSWYDSSTYLLPKDFTALHEAVTAVKTKALKGCESDPVNH